MIALRLMRPGSLVLQAGLVLLAAVAVAAVVDQAHPAVTSPTPRVFDSRPAGEQAVDQAQRRLAAAPQDPRAMTRLATAYLLRVRETGDPFYYPRAEALLERASAAAPDQVETVVALSGLAAARHDFSAALGYAERAVALAPESPSSYGVLVDARIELGRYNDAVDAAQRMADLRPDQPALARVSYLRELHGDLPGAIEAMQAAVQAGAPTSEATAWSEYQLGNLYLAAGSLDQADQAYANTTRRIDGYVFGIAGLGRVRAARGDFAGAAELYGQALQRMPLPEFAATLGDIYVWSGQPELAAPQYELVAAMQRLQAANGVRIDVDLGLFSADHDRDLENALEAARAEYGVRRTIQVADTLAWIEYRLGDLENAIEHSQEALRLGTRDPLLLYHAGVIAQAAGDHVHAAELLRASAALNPTFSIRWAPDLAARLAQLSDQGGQP